MEKCVLARKPSLIAEDTRLVRLLPRCGEGDGEDDATPVARLPGLPATVLKPGPEAGLAASVVGRTCVCIIQELWWG